MNHGRPQTLSNVLSELLARRGYGRGQTQASLAEAWREVAGPEFAEWTRPAGLRRGVLEVTAADSTTVQELTFRKRELVEKLDRLLPDARISDVKFRVGALD